MKETFYFSHDYNTRTDEKIKKLIREYGMEGYGIYWSLVENLYNNTNVLKLDYECISYDLRIDAEILKHIINDYGLFEIKDGYFGSRSIERRLNERNTKSEKARESINKRWDKYRRNTNVIRKEYESNTIKERKGKENIEKEKEKEILDSLEQYKITPEQEEFYKKRDEEFLKSLPEVTNVDDNREHPVY